MPELDIAQLGQPVAIGQISHELKKLWETGSGATTRASLVNFTVYCQGTEAMARNTELISEFMRNHACRAILVAVDRDAPTPRIQAWINAHCHLSRAGAKQICCEQISFLLEGAIEGRFTNIVFAHLDSDLPLYFWWQGDLSTNLNPHLWKWIDRLIVDSLVWHEPKAQFARLRESLGEDDARVTLCDLNWTRSLYLRQALAQIFDHPENIAQLSKLTRVTITHAPESRSTAVLLVGWLAAQLSWLRRTVSGELLTFSDACGEPVVVELRAKEGAPISACELTSPSASYTILRDLKSEYFRGEIRLADGRRYQHLLPAGPDDISGLLDEEMMRGGRHRVYLKALAQAEPLLD